jgi:hypothetical protein
MEVNLTEYTVTLKDELTWGDDELINAELVGSMKLDAETRKKLDIAANKARAEGKPMGEDQFKLNGVQMDGRAILNSKMVAAECLVTKIEPKAEGTPDTIPFSREWLMGLNKTDGKELMKAVDTIRNKADDPEEASAEIEGK